MENTDKFALDLLVHDNIDDINKNFYGTYTFPWDASYFRVFPDNELIKIFNQDLGYFKHDRIKEDPKIWVAGCGTNQAIEIALKYPQANVVGTDISVRSLEKCQNNASLLGINNLKLEEKSINAIPYKEEFDYIVCTGVIHHNADPAYTLNKLTGALKQDGVLELMVYNYYHRLFTTAFQKAIRCLSQAPLDLEMQHMMVRKMIKQFPVPGLMANFLKAFETLTDAETADSLMQPVEYSYTIETLEKLISSTGLEFLHYCLNEHDDSQGITSWDLEFRDELLDGMYKKLTDVQRWQIANLLMLDDSPRLWFYTQRHDSRFTRKTEAQICEEFLDTRFKKFSATVKYHFRDNDGNYSTNNKSMRFPMPVEPAQQLARSIYNSVDLGLTMRDIFTLLQVEPSFYNVNAVRNQLCTVTQPYLLADNS